VDPLEDNVTAPEMPPLLVVDRISPLTISTAPPVVRDEPALMMIDPPVEPAWPASRTTLPPVLDVVAV
jgi:hypothetical protein